MNEEASTDLVITDNPAESRYEARLGDVVAGFAMYTISDGVITFTHTVVDPAYGGRGIGTAIIEASLADVRSRGLRVIPRCPFYAKYFAEHRQVDDLRA